MKVSDLPTWALSWVLYAPPLALWRLVRHDWEADAPARGFRWLDRTLYAFVGAARWVQGDGHGPWPCRRDIDKRLAAGWAADEADGGPF